MGFVIPHGTPLMRTFLIVRDEMFSSKAQTTAYGYGHSDNDATSVDKWERLIVTY